MKTPNLKPGNLFFGNMVWSACLVFCDPGLAQTPRELPTAGTTDELRAAVQRAIVPMERAMVGYRENRRCFSCHHHAHAIIGLSEMARRGLDVDRELLQFQFFQSVSRTRMVQQRYLKNQNIGGGVDTTGHALLAMRIGGHQPDETTEAMIWWLLKRKHDQGYWTGTKNRAPTQASDITRTWLCLDAFKHFGPPHLMDEINEQKAKSRDWLLKVDVLSTEDKVSRIRALSVIGNAGEEVKKFAKALVTEQTADGGWAQTDEMESDAYATGSVLMTLNQYAGLSTDQEFYRRGVAFLCSTQLDDGTWHVKTRATRVQEYFESGFPHGRDQYISFTATCWAATAMALTLPEPERQRDQPRIAVGLSLPMVELEPEHHRRFQERFNKEIWPIISDNGKSSCLRCHDDQHQSSFRLSGDTDVDFSTMLGLGFFHPRDPSGIMFPISSENPKLMMPPSKLPRLNDKHVETLTRFASELYQHQEPDNAASKRKTDSSTTDENGFYFFRVESKFQAGETTIRVLLPDKLNDKQQYRVLYVLPVVAGDDRRFGDGLLQIKQHGFHNEHQLICVAPEFTAPPWFADHDGEPALHDESHFLKVVVPFVEKNYPALPESRGRLLIGFSKSGWGAFSLLMRNPKLFHRAAGWDIGIRVDTGPIEEQERAERIARIFGSTENFEKYRLSTLVRNLGDDLGTEVRLFYFNTEGNREFGGAKLHQLMVESGLPHRYVFEPKRKHRWDSGWIPEAVEFLVEKY